MTGMKVAFAWTCGSVLYLIGGFDLFLEALLVCMIVDYLMGLTIAGVFKRSEKSKNGCLDSFVGWMGISKKITSLLFIIIGVELQKVSGLAGIREGVILALIVNELISIIENAGIMGIPVPDPIKKMIDVLKPQVDSATNESK